MENCAKKLQNSIIEGSCHDYGISSSETSIFLKIESIKFVLPESDAYGSYLGRPKICSIIDSPIVFLILNGRTDYCV